ncbi:hypothetical protein [Bacillus sp. OAE603]|uniref:hypothetical protein n=1 Tax=Gottfriedia sp. OAE603 TaxID=2663872 RepID=UPI00178A332E
MMNYKILDTNATVKIPMGTNSNVIKDKSILMEEGHVDEKSDYTIDYYAKGKGMIKTEFYNSDDTINQVQELYNDKGIVPKQIED